MWCFVFLVSIFAKRISGSTVWEDLNAVFGDHMASTFTATTFSEVLKKPNLTPVGYGFTVACATYMDGHRLAMMQRNGEELPFKVEPILVEKNEDLMCFSVTTPKRPTPFPNITHSQAHPTPIPNISHPLIKFFYVVDPELKVHGSAYDFIDQKFTASKVVTSTPNKAEPEVPFEVGKDLVVIYHNGSITSKEEDKRAYEYFTTKIRDLQRYDLKTLKQFYWSTPSTHTHFLTALRSLSPQENLDRKRASMWSYLTHYFEVGLIRAKAAKPNPGAIRADPCGFGSLKQPHTQKNRISIPMEMFQHHDSAMSASCMAFAVSTLAQEPHVRLIAIESRPVPLNFRVRSISQTGTLGSSLTDNTPYSGAGLLGDGELGSVADTGLDLNNCYFTDSSGATPPISTLANPAFCDNCRKVKGYLFNPGSGDGVDIPEGHGSHVSGTMLGSIENGDLTSETNGLYDGVAPNARIVFIDLSSGPDSGIGPPSTSALFYQPGYDTGVRVHSNSWGGMFGGSGYYANADTDDYLYSHKDFMVFYASGNSGQLDNGVTTQSTAKNAVSVGCSETSFDSTNMDFLAYYSSHGPTYDGRIKPDIVSPGDAVMSVNALTACDVMEKAGTSMSTPGAAGHALLIKQYFKDPNNNFWLQTCNLNYDSCQAGFEPSGFLVKAILLHSGSAVQQVDGVPGGIPDVTLGNPPDFYQGYGRITFSNVLPLQGVFTNFDLFVQDYISINEFARTSFHAYVADSSYPLKVTIAWYDPPNQQGSTGPALLHDLDLLVTGPDGSVYLGNGGNGQGGSDSVNTNEQVFVSSPATGRWQIFVVSNSLPQGGTEQFAISITCSGYTSLPSASDTDDYYN